MAEPTQDSFQLTERSRNTLKTKDEAPDLPGERSGDDHESIGDYAARVLWSDNLSEKLEIRAIERVSWQTSDHALSPTNKFSPGRPHFLKFASSGAARPRLPSRPSLVDEKNRGILLHFFANHELLAAELMALALLKFPDAPLAFRKGLAATLQDEQRHTRWYLARMAECGVEFGDYPVSPFFWDAVSSMESPIDYVSRLSLTFEQANLDYSRYYGDMLQVAGDEASAAILHRIYEDEKVHVGYGLHWFRKWKEPLESDWDALARRLPFPLSPARAKAGGLVFNEQGRREVGFDESYIRNLTLFERSKGRTPNLYYFNGDAELRAARYPEIYHPKDSAKSLNADLEILISFLARRDDVVLLRQLPGPEHREKLAKLGFVLPEFSELCDHGGLRDGDLLHQRRLHTFRPWAKGPDLQSWFGGLNFTSPIALATLDWTCESCLLFSKARQSQLLPQWFGQTCVAQESEEVLATLERWSDAGIAHAVWKPSLSTAGRGMRRIALGDLRASYENDTVNPFPEGIFEPWHDRLFDFSVQYEIQSGEIRFLGFVRQMVSAAGAYRGSIVPTKFCQDLDPSIARFLMTKVLPCYQVDGAFVRDLLAWAAGCAYEGPLGVDAYVHRLLDGALAHRVLCEINPRYTMGRVALELKKQISPGRSLSLDLLKLGHETPATANPTLDKDGLLQQGSVILNEIFQNTRFAARLTVGKNLEFRENTPILDTCGL
jgi:uncharacterized ferritin-like protein (DUF455 family)